MFGFEKKYMRSAFAGCDQDLFSPAVNSLFPTAVSQMPLDTHYEVMKLLTFSCCLTPTPSSFLLSWGMLPLYMEFHFGCNG